MRKPAAARQRRRNATSSRLARPLEVGIPRGSVRAHILERRVKLSDHGRERPFNERERCQDADLSRAEQPSWFGTLGGADVGHWSNAVRRCVPAVPEGLRDALLVQRRCNRSGCTTRSDQPAQEAHGGDTRRGRARSRGVLGRRQRDLGSRRSTSRSTRVTAASSSRPCTKSSSTSTCIRRAGEPIVPQMTVQQYLAGGTRRRRSAAFRSTCRATTRTPLPPGRGTSASRSSWPRSST